MSKLAYQRPVVGPKHYLAVGASGWVETFGRDLADKDLKSFIKEVPLDQLVDTFVKQQQVSSVKKTHWHNVVDYLARIFNIPKNTIPITVSVAFWAQVTLVDNYVVEA